MRLALPIGDRTAAVPLAPDGSRCVTGVALPVDAGCCSKEPWEPGHNAMDNDPVRPWGRPAPTAARGDAVGGHVSSMFTGIQVVEVASFQVVPAAEPALGSVTGESRSLSEVTRTC